MPHGAAGHHDDAPSGKLIAFLPPRTQARNVALSIGKCGWTFIMHLARSYIPMAHVKEGRGVHGDPRLRKRRRMTSERGAITTVQNSKVNYKFFCHVHGEERSAESLSTPPAFWPA